MALGAIPVVIDAAGRHRLMNDGPTTTPDGLFALKFYTVINHVALTNHVFSVQPLIGSKSKIDALPPPLQKILREEAKAITPSWRALAAKRIDDATQGLKGKGVTFTEIDYNAFRKLMDPIYTSLSSKLAEVTGFNEFAGAAALDDLEKPQLADLFLPGPPELKLSRHWA